MILNLIKIFYARIRFKLNNLVYNKSTYSNNNLNINISKIINELNENGFCLINNFMNREMCEEIIKIFNEGIKKFENVVIVDENKCDFRMFGSENLNLEIKNYHLNEFIKNISEKFLKTKTINLSTMTNKVRFIKKNLGSGSAEWHRDSFNKQFKSILYLSDVKNGGGGFQLIENSHKIMQMIKDSRDMSVDILKLRVKNSLVQDRILKKSPHRLRTIEVDAGTLILVDTSLLHRGSPIQEGSNDRYAMTNYIYPYYQRNWYPTHFEKSLKKEI